MNDRLLVAKRINNGQSEIWFEHKPNHRRTVATNGILYPVRTTCSPDESNAFHKALGEGVATIPQAVADKLITGFGLEP
jgi:hypothetical protein